MAIPFKYNRRSLLIRRVSNSMTVGAIAIVVGVFVAAMAIVGGLDSAIKDSSSPDNMILIGRGADSEANSFITLDQLDALKFLPAVKRDGVGNPLVSPELTEQVFMPAGDTLDNLPIRGVLPVSAQIHEKVRIIAGRMFAPGLNEVIIGKLGQLRFANYQCGERSRTEEQQIAPSPAAQNRGFDFNRFDRPFAECALKLLQE
jgi:putative ABC transport system permease protein